jgi:hypothetical protein
MSEEYTSTNGLRTAFGRAAKAVEELYKWSENAKDPAGNFPSVELHRDIRASFMTLSGFIEAADKKAAWQAEADRYAMEQKTREMREMWPLMQAKDPT